MKKIISQKEKKEMRSKLAVAFQKEIMNLSKENQEILLDDIVTAFQNRIVVFNRAKLDYMDTKGNIEFRCDPIISQLEEH